VLNFCVLKLELLEASTTAESSRSRSPTSPVPTDAANETDSDTDTAESAGERQSNPQSDNNNDRLTAGSLAAVAISTLLSAIASGCLTAVLLTVVAYYRKRRNLSRKGNSATAGARNGYERNSTVNTVANEAYESSSRSEGGHPEILLENDSQSNGQSLIYNATYQTAYTLHQDYSPVYTYIEETFV